MAGGADHKKDKQMRLSVVICVYNEEKNIKPLGKKLEQALKGIDHEIIMVDDGSVDNTTGEVLKLKNKRLQLVELKKNYGQSTALVAGIDYAKGDYIATLDGDLQNDPDDIPFMLKKAHKEGWDVVAGIRAKRKDGFLIRKIPSKIANYIIRMTTGLKMKDYGCTLKVFKSGIAKDLGLYGELHRFIPVLAYMQGATIIQVEVKHHARIHGKSKYGINRTFKVMVDLMLMLFFKKYMQKPMHLFGVLGLILSLIGAGLNIYLVILKILGQDIWGRPLMILGMIALIGGIQLITVGILAEIMMRTYYESQDKKTYRLRRIRKNKT
jgi:glycosyltransferase involved in cell wall biosynthesis